MKFLATGIIAAVFALESNAATVSNLRSLQVENCRFHNEAGDCTECIYRYVLDDGACRAVSNQCNTWNQSSGACTSCYPGWTLSNGECVVGGGSEQPTEPPTEVPTEPPTEQPTQPGNSECDFRQVKIDGVCVNVSNQCNTWDQVSGACTSCYPGWSLSNGECVVGGGSEQPTEPPTEVPTEPPTEQPNQPSCYFRQVRINGNCVNVSDQCNTWNETTGACTSCYGGYTLTSGGQCTA